MEVCAICGTSDDVEEEQTPDGATLLTCDGGGHEPRTWAKYEEPVGLPARDGLGEELGIYEDLPALLSQDEPVVEYGVVEHRNALAHPEEYRVLIERYGHTALAPSRYTASAFLARALGQLTREGAVVFRSVPATGRWHYNGQISGWCLPGTPAESADEVLSWAEFANQNDIDPATWPALNGDD